MRIWRDLEQTGLTIEEVVPGAAIEGDVFIEFHCPGCSEFHSVTCDCDRDETSAFFCACVPDTCPSCDAAFGYEPLEVAV